MWTIVSWPTASSRRSKADWTRRSLRTRSTRWKESRRSGIGSSMGGLASRGPCAATPLSSSTSSTSPTSIRRTCPPDVPASAPRGHPSAGLPMTTRTGSSDPGALLYLHRHAGVSEAELTEALDRKGGLMALTGTPDMREILRRIAGGDEDAELAFDVYIHRLRGLIASMAAAMNGLDVLVFTGGVGENAAPVRAAAVAGLRFLGIEIGPTLNASLGPDNNISAPGATVPTLVIKSREDIEVAREVRKVLAISPPGGH